MTTQTAPRTAIAAQPRRRRVTLLGLLGDWTHNWRSRRALARMTSAQLDDIGVTAAEARKEASLPFWVGRH